MKALMNVVKTGVAGIAGLAFGLCALADEVNVDSLLQESALWLDAAELSSFQRNGSGGVTTWANQSVNGRATYGDAKAYYVPDRNGIRTHDLNNPATLYGTVGLVNGAPAYRMGGMGSRIDLCYNTITGIGTVFLVGDFSADDVLAPLLGDANECHFHRGGSGKFVHTSYCLTPMHVWHNSATDEVPDLTAATARPNPDEMNFIILEAENGAQSDQLSRDRDDRTRNGGRDLHEVIVFTRRLTAAERKAVYDYLYAKWHDGGWNKGQYRDFLLQGSALWLDAADPMSLQRNGSGGVTTWVNQSVNGRATYGDAKAYYVPTAYGVRTHDLNNPATLYGTVGLVNGAPAYRMGVMGSRIDLCYNTITGIGTVFLVGDFSVDDELSPLLGDAYKCDFHRGGSGKFVNTNHCLTPIHVWHNSATDEVPDFTASTARPNPGEMNFIILETESGAQSDQLSRDRDAPPRSGGRDLHEVLVFTRRLTAEERKMVYDYLYAKWHDGGWDKGQYDSYVAPVNGVTADWFALPWTTNGVSAVFPESVAINEARLEVGGESSVSFSKTVRSASTKVVNAGAGAALVTFTGPAALTGSLGLENFNGSVYIRGMNVEGSVALGSQSALGFNAGAGEAWTSGVRRVTGGDVVKSGTGSDVLTGVPEATIDVCEGALGLLVTQNVSTASLNVKSTTKAGVFEKRGSGTLTLTGAGVVDAQVKVLEGTLDVSRGAPKNTTLRGITATQEKPFYIGSGATAVIDGEYASRLPNDAFIKVDGGKLVLRGVNALDGDYPLSIDSTDGIVDFNHYVASQHIKIRDLTMGNSELKLTGTSSAYHTQGIVVWGRIAGIEGESFIRSDDGTPNYICFLFAGDGEGVIEVKDGARMVFDNARFMYPPHKTGAGTLVFGDRPSVFGAEAKTLKLDEGYLLANAMTETANDNLTTVQIGNGAGFDLSVRTADNLTWTPAFALTAADATVETKVLVKLPAVRLKADTKLIACTIPEGNCMVFKDAAGKVGLVKKSDGVYVDRGITILVR